MQDVRIERWAHTLVHYSLSVQPEDTVVIASTPLAEPLVEAVFRAVLGAGAYPLPMVIPEILRETLLREGNDAQLAKTAFFDKLLAEYTDALLFIDAASNTSAWSTINPARIAALQTSYREVDKLRSEREQAGKFRWSYTLYPTSAYAQDTDMSLREFEEFVFQACFLNDPDPIARWKDLSRQQQRFVDWLVGHEQVQIKGDGTDLTLSIKDRVFINSDGKKNFPSGEFFTGPVENSAQGSISFDIPLSYGGRKIEGIRLAFRDGKVVEASARQGQAFLEEMLVMDDGARYLGEFAFGNNPGVDRGTRHILFDEKMGGTIHLALGKSYPETGGMNESALHMDLVCDLRKNGEVWIDDTLFLKDGKLLV